MSTSNALNQSPPSDIAAARAVAHAADHRSHQHHQSIGASWAAIFAGATAAAALSLILLFLGVGLGLSSVSPWAQDGISVATFGVTTIVWITITQLFASGMGGYLAGRLSTKWVSIHTDEVFFRDTANGFLAWAVASLATAMMLSSAIGGIVGGGVRMGVTVAAASSTSAVTTATAAGGAVLGMATQPNNVGDTSGAMSYFLDSMFRRDMTAAPAATQAPTTGSTTGATTTAPPVLSSMGNTMRNYSATTNATSNGTANAVQSTNEVASIFANSLRTGA